ncbi:MAG: hypothetical protein A3F54_03770 [Candidatus Kerfeldbacteria bacterium RIFCSPHIGHO2_12_FULL_48_17]|uniref:LysM domain-containing protein n=1 Tax=Candidatus Kerfeldbacteria bacterium RIFCSPHIGHO2_12_FULL_48_17 TaxID=1798542 RepID=A0A1G2B6E9_9BACT|nr:MAG: hypothetical protein A3F54_03770 [Candidatus Kerfeldbacteria bacterium RIFCSPHIGHO2_12_FULL_48_17]
MRSLENIQKTRIFIVFLFLLKPFIFVWHLFVRFFLLKFYRVYLRISKAAKERIFVNRNRFLFIFTHRYVIHISIILAAFFVGAQNIRAQEATVSDLGRNSFLSALVDTENQDVVETAESNTATQSSSLSYIDSTGLIKAVQPKIGDVDFDVDSGVAESGSALVRTNVATTTISDKTRTDVEYHIVEGGETISTIAQKYKVSVKTILDENGLKESDFIKPGDKLTILPLSGVSHQVKSGDTLQAIANKYKADVDKIIEYNQLASADDIHADEILIVPGGVAPPPPTPPKPVASSGSLAAVKNFFSNDAPPAAAPSGGKFQWPTSCRRISQYFRYGHTGVDIDCEFGDPIYAPESGVVTHAGWEGAYGISVIINHGGGFSTRLAHLQTLYVSSGQSVSRGQSVGQMGSTGRSTGSHLHYEVRISGAAANPLSY